jgi:hypothetical protein
MYKRENHSKAKRPHLTYSADAASGASHEKGQTLLPMLIAGLILIFVGMVAVVLLI